MEPGRLAFERYRQHAAASDAPLSKEQSRGLVVRDNVVKQGFAFDEIGRWSEMKLEIVRKYAKAYSTILAKQPGFTHYYIDGFAGAGLHISKATGGLVLGSPLNVLGVEPAFRHYFFVDIDHKRVHMLEQIVGRRADVTIQQGDCNAVLPRDIFPRVRYDEYRRAFCLLDPYGMQLQWQVVAAAGHLRTVDLLLNFPIMDANRNTLWSKPERVSASGAARLTAFWGDESWKDVAYRPSPQSSLFGDTEMEKAPNEAIVEAFRERLRVVAGFKNVPAPMAMKNSQNAVVYYLFFASQNDNASKIVSGVFRSAARGGGKP